TIPTHRLPRSASPRQFTNVSRPDSAPCLNADHVTDIKIAPRQIRVRGIQRELHRKTARRFRLRLPRLLQRLNRIASTRLSNRNIARTPVILFTCLVRKLIKYKELVSGHLRQHLAAALNDLRSHRTDKRDARNNRSNRRLNANFDKIVKTFRRLTTNQET